MIVVHFFLFCLFVFVKMLPGEGRRGLRLRLAVEAWRAQLTRSAAGRYSGADGRRFLGRPPRARLLFSCPCSPQFRTSIRPPRLSHRRRYPKKFSSSLCRTQNFQKRGKFSTCRTASVLTSLVTRFINV